MRAWLTEWLVANANAKLEQGGHMQSGVALQRVFVDLPASLSRFEATNQNKVAFLAHFMAAPGIAFCDSDVASQIIDGELSPESACLQTAQSSLTANNDGAFLLIGGPGQGKSTVSQFACQLHRAALLAPFKDKLSTSQQELLTSFFPTGKSQKSAKARLTPPTEAFLPLQINLPDLSRWLAQNQTSITKPDAPAILHFLANLPSAKIAKCTLSTLIRICSEMPCLVVLDGFDEIGAQEDRSQIVTVTRELIEFLRLAKRTIKVLATTRPQGYTGELAHIGLPLREATLDLLSKEQALGYASALITAKISGHDEQQKLLNRLEEAASEPATERLMSTPLQVTILAALVQRMGRAPRERWNLFAKYFEYTYDREVERETYASRLLAEYKMHVVQIHTHVALLLQVEAEQRGGGAARMGKDQLQEVIIATLAKDGYGPANSLDLAREIIKAAEERLVFLVTPEPDSFGFEIRSLQEFMAAWALTSNAEKTKDRLKAIAKASMFRNVLLFAASRLYSELSDLRATFPDEICDSLEENDELARLACAGALLALETLEEGAALNQPTHARALMRRALPLLKLTPSEKHERLGRIANKDTAQILWEALEAELTSFGPNSGDSGARFCVQAITIPKKEWPPTLIGKFDEISVLDEKLVFWQVNNDLFLTSDIDETRAFLATLMTEKWIPNQLHRLANEYFPFLLQYEKTPEGLASRLEHLKQMETNTLQVQVDLTILQIGYGTFNLDNDTFLRDVDTIAQITPRAWRSIFIAFCSNKMPHNWQASWLITALSKYKIPLSGRYFASLCIDNLLKNSKSDLANPTTWNTLALPLPLPTSASASQQETEIPATPVQIDTLELQNIRGLQHLQFNPAQAEEGHGQWTVILGENGVGKTTLLRSLAVALRNSSDPTIWPPGAFSNSWLRQGGNADVIHEAAISVSMNGYAPQRTVIKQNGSTSVKQTPAQTRARIVPLFAYGCRRGSALGGASRKLDLSENEGPEIATLFDTGADIIHAETWLTKLDSAASKDAANAQLLETIKKALCEFLDIAQISIEADGIFITERTGLRLPFEMLSDGYLTSAGWFLDLIARWLTLAQKNQIVITPDFMQHMRGLVLIDEIDLHLHPAWQIEIVSRTRSALPQMSFVVTTHNPLTLVGAKAHEIWMLERNGDQIAIKPGEETPMFLTGGQIYRRYFGIKDIYPSQLGRDMQRFEFLAGYAGRNDAEQAEMETLKASLLKHGIEPEWDIVPREMPTAAPKKSRTRKPREKA